MSPIQLQRVNGTNLLGAFLYFWAKASIEGKGVGLDSLHGIPLEPTCVQDKALQIRYVYVEK